MPLVFCECGSLMNDDKCSNKRCPAKKSKQKGWVIEGVCLDFRHPVTFEEAVALKSRLDKVADEEFGKD